MNPFKACQCTCHWLHLDPGMSVEDPGPEDGPQRACTAQPALAGHRVPLPPALPKPQRKRLPSWLALDPQKFPSRLVLCQGAGCRPGCVSGTWQDGCPLWEGSCQSCVEPLLAWLLHVCSTRGLCWEAQTLTSATQPWPSEYFIGIDFALSLQMFLL